MPDPDSKAERIGEMSAKDSNLNQSINEFVNKNFLMNSGAVEFTNDDSLVEKGIIDSTGVLEMISFIQQQFGIKVKDEDLIPENLDSVNNIASFITRKINERDPDARFNIE